MLPLKPFPESPRGGDSSLLSISCPFLLGTCNKCCTFLHHNLVSISWLCFLVGGQIPVGSNFGDHEGTANGTLAPGQWLPEHFCLRNSPECLPPTRHHWPMVFFYFCEGNKALALVCKMSLVSGRTSCVTTPGYSSLLDCLNWNFPFEGVMHRTWSCAFEWSTALTGFSLLGHPAPPEW